MTKRRLRALVIDDEPTIRLLVRRALEGAFEVIEVAGGIDALDQAAESLPDLVVLDWQMPGMTGLEVLTSFGMSNPHLPVILLTGQVGAEHGGLAEIFGAAAFVTKPFSPAELLETAERLTGDRRARRPNGGQAAS